MPRCLILMVLFSLDALSFTTTVYPEVSYNGDASVSWDMEAYDIFHKRAGLSPTVTLDVLASSGERIQDYEEHFPATSLALKGLLEGKYSYRLRICGAYASLNWGGCVFSSAVPFEVRSASDAIYYTTRSEGGTGVAGCIGSTLCNELSWGVDLRESAGYQWNVDGRDGGRANMFVKVSSPSGTRSMSLWLNDEYVGVVTASADQSTRARGVEVGPFNVGLQPAFNKVELRDSEGTAEFDVLSLSVSGLNFPDCTDRGCSNVYEVLPTFSADGVRGCTGDKNCNLMPQGVDLNSNTGYSWRVHGEDRQLVELYFNVASPNGERTMGVWVNGFKVSTLTTDDVSSPRPLGSKIGPIDVMFKPGVNVIELRDTEGTAEFDIHYLQVIYQRDQVNALFVPFSFTDQSLNLGAVNLNWFDDAFNQEGYSDGGAMGSIFDFYHSVSGGQLELRHQVPDEIININQPSTDFFTIDSNGTLQTEFGEIIEAATQAYLSSGLDYEEITLNRVGGVRASTYVGERSLGRGRLPPVSPPGLVSCRETDAGTIDLNESTGYRWVFELQEQKSVKMSIDAAVPSGGRQMSLWVNNELIDVLSTNSTESPLPLGSTIYESEVTLKAGENFVDLRDTEGTGEFNVVALSAESQGSVENYYSGESQGGLGTFGCISSLVDEAGQFIRRGHLTSPGDGNNGLPNGAPSLSAIAHELGHALYDWNDLYGKSSIGQHGLMGGGTSNGNPVPPNPYYRYQAGWGTLTEINLRQLPVTVSVRANSNHNYKITNPQNHREFLVLSGNRGDNSSVGNINQRFWGLLPGRGLALWHIGEDGWGSDVDPSNIPRGIEPEFQVFLEEADGGWATDDGDASDSDVFIGGGTLFPVSSETGHWWDGSEYSFEIRDVSILGDVVTFTIDKRSK